MESRCEEPKKALEPGAAQKPNRFRIVKLEERIAPAKGGKATHKCFTTPTCVCDTYDPTCFMC